MITSDATPPKDHARPHRAPAKTSRAIVAEADPVTRKQCAEVLSQLGFAVELRDSGIGTVVAAREAPPDLIVLGQLRDVRAPEAIGWLEANAALQATPLLVIDGAPADETVRGRTRRISRIRRPISPMKLRRLIVELFPGR